MARNKNGKPRQPTKLGAAGKTLWDEVLDSCTLNPGEIEILKSACYEADLIDSIQRKILEPGFSFRVKGSNGQWVAAPELLEIRQHRDSMRKLLGSLKLPQDIEEAVPKPLDDGVVVQAVFR